MATTTIRLSEELKARVARVAQRAFTTSHGFIVEAIAETAEREERRGDFDRYRRASLCRDHCQWQDRAVERDAPLSRRPGCGQEGGSPGGPQAGSLRMSRIELSRQPVPQLALVPQSEQHHIPFGVGIDHDVASQHKLAESRHAERSRELDGLLRLELPPTGLGVEESGRATARGCERQETSGLDQLSLQLLEARRRRSGILRDHEAARGTQADQEVRNCPNLGVDRNAHRTGVTPSASSSSSSETNCPDRACLSPVTASSTSTSLACSASSAW